MIDALFECDFTSRIFTTDITEAGQAVKKLKKQMTKEELKLNRQQRKKDLKQSRQQAERKDMFLIITQSKQIWAELRRSEIT